MEKQTIFVGLGNPGKEYALTRHNIGYLVIHAFALDSGWIFKEEKEFTAHVAKGKIGNAIVHLVLPLTYMNESGRTVRCYLDYYKLTPQHIGAVISDDADILFGTMRLRPQGSSGGHNGLKSIENHLHTQNFARLRMGIGREQQGDRPLADYVLDRFTQEELKALVPFVGHAKDILKRLIDEEITTVMNSVDKK